ncbi:MAG: hypothetical protein M1281_07890 [Chloroflexi bacterium]|nr:hypothetical protein [Chloroflexota bacterium]
MLSLTFVFWMYVVLFAVIGAMRGWAKELLVSFAVILALFIITIVERFVPFVRDTLSGESLFWVKSGLLMGLVFFGYQTPNLRRFAESNKFARERLQDVMLGLFLGGINGYLVVGTLWFFLNEASYPFTSIQPPLPTDPMGAAALKLIPFLPPSWLGAPGIYFAVGIAFVFVMVVFL